MLPEIVQQKLESLPVQPGVYLFKDKKGAVVYVGKAKSLRARVRSYFQAAGSDNRYFIPILQRTIGDLETIVASSEKEATILENNLIKEHRPRYNVKLRDDKDYITLRLATDHAWPRLDVVRRPTPDGARYFGPYHSATAARRTLHLINKHFQLRTCGNTEFESRRRPCLQYQIKRCPAPCVLDVDPKWYAEQVDNVVKFLDGRHDELSAELDAKMKDAARSMRFELAVVYRDQLKAIETVREEQRVVTVDRTDRDVLGIYREADLVEVALLYIRAGKLADVATFAIKQAEIPDEEIVAAFLAQHYGGAQTSKVEDEEESPAQEAAPVLIPEEIVLPNEPEGLEGIGEWLSDRSGHKVALIRPKRGSKVDLLAMANDNARHAFIEKRRQSDDVQDRLRELQEKLRLPTLPRRIECCDISHLGGGDTVGAIVSMADGAPDKKHYRTFHVRGPELKDGAINDDYASMYEVLARRFRRGASASASAGEEEKEWELPDLFVVDGGRGQLGVALAAAHDLGLHELPIVGLAKERENVAGEQLVDRVYLPGQKNPIPLKSNTASLFFLARARDEAHRFSNKARERLGKKRRFKSELDDIKGIGPVAKKALFLRFGTIAAIKAADDKALLETPGVTERHVKALRSVYPAPAAKSEDGPGV
jgi:excinuclease ABC subunit C